VFSLLTTTVRASTATVSDAVSMPAVGAGRELGVLDRAGGVVDVGLAAAELLEAAAGAGDADGHADAGLDGAELFGHRFGDRKDGARAVDGDRALQAIGGGAAGGVAAAARHQRAQADGAWNQAGDEPLLHDSRFPCSVRRGDGGRPDDRQRAGSP
jgi:hypothetical protein